MEAKGAEVNQSASSEGVIRVVQCTRRTTDVIQYSKDSIMNNVIGNEGRGGWALYSEGKHHTTCIGTDELS